MLMGGYGMISKRIAVARKQKGWIQTQLAEALGVSVDTVRRWEQEKRTPDTNMLQKLAQALDTTTAYLLGEVDDPARLSASPPTSKTVALPESNAHETSIVWVPVVSSEVKVCCGEGNLYPEEVTWEEVGRYPIPFSDIAGYGWQVGDRGIRILTVEGDSMKPRIEDGDKILFADVQPLSGDVAVITYMGRLLVRGVTFETKRVRLTAFNPEYSEIVVPVVKDMDELCILGKVIATVKISPMRGRMW